jgi:hypothetical protein
MTDDEIGPAPEWPDEATQQPAGPLAVSPAVPARPVSGAVIASAWGTDVHDRIYTPKGVVVNGAQITNPTNFNPLPIDAVLAGDAAYANLASDVIAIPAGRDGLYQCSALVTAVSLAAAEIAWVELLHNGTVIAGAYFAPGMTTNTVPSSMGAIAALVAADQIYVRAVHLGSTVKLKLERLSVVRIGHALT